MVGICIDCKNFAEKKGLMYVPNVRKSVRDYRCDDCLGYNIEDEE
jgi:hypothetical protein